MAVRWNNSQHFSWTHVKVTLWNAQFKVHINEINYFRLKRVKVHAQLWMHRDCNLWPDVWPTLMMSSLLPGCLPGATAEWQRSSTNDGSLIRSASSTYYYSAVLLPWWLEKGAERDPPRLCPLVLGHSTPMPISANQCQCKLAGLYIIKQGPLSPVASLTYGASDVWLKLSSAERQAVLIQTNLHFQFSNKSVQIQLSWMSIVFFCFCFGLNYWKCTKKMTGMR